MWNEGAHPTDFMEILYGEDSEELLSDEEIFSDEEVMDSLSLQAPTFSLLTLPKRQNEVPVSSRARSRSPLQAPELYESARIKIQMFNEDGADVRGEDLFHSDAHVLYERPESDVSLENDIRGSIGERGATDDRNDSRARSVRGRPRKGRGCPNRGHGGGHLRHQASSWQPGQPLTEIWLTDEDVPEELRKMARDVVRRRQVRVQSVPRGRSTHVRLVGQNDGNVSESVAENVLYDATDGRSDSRLAGEDLHFEWSPMETFRGKEETFIPEHTGSVASYTTPYDAFRSYWDDGILQTIVDETNRYAEQISAKSAHFQSEWYATNVHELLCLFAFWMMTGIIQMPTIHSYFSTHSLLKTEIFSNITTLKRYKNLNRALYFVEPAYHTNSGAANSNRMHHLKPIIDHLNLKFQSNYILSKDICIGESLLLWKGRLNFEQCIRSKTAKLGLTTFELCESATGYLWSFLVNTSKQSSDGHSNIPKSTAVVLELIQPLLNKGYRLFMDDSFNFPLLARFLKRNGTDCVGTLCHCREDVPRIVTHAPLKRGELIARHSGDVCVLSWLDKKRITMLSTCHGSAIGLPTVSSRPMSSRPVLFKPHSILDYNHSMGGVDLKDQMLEPYLLERKRCPKWYLTLFKRLLNASIQNSRILLESTLKARQDNLKFRLELVQSILTHHHAFIPSHRKYQLSHSRIAPFPHKVNHGHWPVQVPQTTSDLKRNRHGRQRCAVCFQEERKVQMTRYKCEMCNVPLCVEPCFKKHHSA